MVSYKAKNARKKSILEIIHSYALYGNKLLIKK
jgi:hypothetical protein